MITGQKQLFCRNKAWSLKLFNFVAFPLPQLRHPEGKTCRTPHSRLHSSISLLSIPTSSSFLQYHGKAKMETFIIHVAPSAPTGNISATTKDLRTRPELYFAVRHNSLLFIYREFS